MLSSLFNSSSIPVLEQVANFSSARHSVLAGNIANMDTPGYQARDLSPDVFQSRLKAALVERDQAKQSYGRTSASAGGGDSLASPIQEVTHSMEGMLRHDQDNVSLEQQVAEITKNQMQNSMALSILSSQFRLLQAAISERA